MGLKNDLWIIERCEMDKMIQPYSHKQVKHLEVHPAKPDIKAISFGVSSYGYDMRVGGDFKIFTNQWPGVIDPKHFDGQVKFVEESRTALEIGNPVVIPPNSFALARSMEYFRIPRNVLTICLGKSTYARCGVVVNVTAFEPEWEGNVTIEISNTTPLPVLIYPFEGIAQVLFFEADDVCAESYADKGGKYQKQTGITLPKV